MSEPLAISKALPLKSSLGGEELKAQQEAKLKDAAKMYEQHFLQEMVKAMRKTVTPGFEAPNFAEKIYREQLDTKYVEAWAERGGIGLGDLIYKQMQQKFFPDSSAQLPQPKGPIPVEARPRVKATPQTQQRIDLSFEMPSSAKSISVTAPWRSQVMAVEPLANGDTGVLLHHPEFNLDSRLVFRGEPFATAVTNEIPAGAKIGQSAGPTTLYWTVCRS